MRISEPQRKLLEEIRANGILYVRRWGRYSRTVSALRQKGLVKIVEPDYSQQGMDGYSANEP